MGILVPPAGVLGARYNLRLPLGHIRVVLLLVIPEEHADLMACLAVVEVCLSQDRLSEAAVCGWLGVLLVLGFCAGLALLRRWHMWYTGV